MELETTKIKIKDAAEGSELPDKVYSYLSAAFGIPVKKLEKHEWQKTLKLFVESQKLFPEITIPIIKNAPKGGKDVDWHYPDREWIDYANILAGAYGWTLEYIAELGVNEALGLIQEILTDEHLEKEFYYGLSEVAYKYDKGTKKSNYVPMKRPYWMNPVAKAPKKYKMLKSMMPVGLVQDVSGLPEEFRIQGYDSIRENTRVSKEKTNP